jgi:hypothetical protein
VTTHVLEELSSRLAQAAADLRDGNTHPDDALALIEECARLAGEAAAAVDGRVRASLEPSPDLPGQLPLTASS